MPLPDFLIIGAPKAGTTALHAALAMHPVLYMSPVKEPKFFLTDGPPRTAAAAPGTSRPGVSTSGGERTTRPCSSRPPRASCAPSPPRSTCTTTRRSAGSGP